MKNEETSFSSPEPTGAIISQFYVALQKCFELKKGEMVLIEIDGDVSLINDEEKNSTQIEVKEYFDPLTNSDLNFWKTLKNWLNDNFKQNSYKTLLLVTTQQIGVRSKLQSWNDKSVDEKFEIVDEIYNKAVLRYNKRKNAERAKESVKPKALMIMEEIFTSNTKEKLKEILKKIEIISSHTKRDKIVEEIIERELKAVPETNKKKALDSLLGYVINEENYNEGWRISEVYFREAVEDVVRSNVEGTTIFPQNSDYKKVTEDEHNEVQKYNFIKKIEEIEYTEAITTSVAEYWFTFKTISEEFNGRKSRKESLENYQDELKRAHDPEYRSASRNCCKADVIDKSQDFFDSIMTRNSPNLDLFNNTPLIFKNGMYHILANDNEHNIHWKLSPRDE